MMADLCDKPFMNMESAINHPCQALADWKTMDDLGVPQHGKFVLSWVYHPRALPLAVPAATVHMAAQRGMEVVVLRPKGYALPERDHGRRRKAAAAASGGTVTETTDRGAALRARTSSTRRNGARRRTTATPEAERGCAQPLGDWCVRENWFRNARPDCHFMHCLPVRRNVAVADEVLDGPRSLVIREAANRMVVQMAVLHRLLKG